MRVLTALALAATSLLPSAFGSTKTEAVAPITSQWIDANGISLRYAISGSGENVVVLLHEVGMTLEAWDYLVPFLQPGRKILRYDSRGFGLSQKVDGPVTIDEHVADLKALLDALHIHQKVTLFGGAINALTVMKFASLYPERVRGIVISSPAFSATSTPQVSSQTSAVAIAPISVEQFEARAYLTEARLEDFYPSQLRTDIAKYQRFLGMEHATGASSRATIVRAAQNGAADIARALPEVSVPTLVIATTMFGNNTEEQAAGIIKAMRNARMEALNTGHFAALESPELVAPVLMKFLAAIRD